MEKKYLLCEKNWVYYFLMMVSGVYGAFTYLLRGNVFCNAQTGNILLMGLAFGSGKWQKALYYLFPFMAYFLGSFVSELLPNPVKRIFKIRWETLLIGIEVCAVLFLGFLPETAPVQISQLCVNFIASMQYNTFRQAQGVPMATTFATNHVRQIAVGIATELRHRNNEDKSHRIKFKKHLCMLIFFFAGVVIGTVCCNLWQGKAILIALIPLVVLFVLFVREDLRYGKQILSQKPHGH